MNIPEIKGKSMSINPMSSSSVPHSSASEKPSLDQDSRNSSLLEPTGKTGNLQSWLEQKNIKLSASLLKELELVLESTEGTTQQKRNTMTVMADRNISFTPKHFQSVFQALHGLPLDKIFQELTKTTDYQHAPLQAHVEQPDQYKKAAVALDSILSFLSEGNRGEDFRKIQSGLRQVLEQMNPVIQNKEVLSELKRSLDLIPQLQSAQIEDIIKQAKTGFQSENREAQAKTFIRVEKQVTPQLEKLAKEFQDTKGQLTRNIDQMSTLLQDNRQAATATVDRLLKATMDGFNKLINKGEFSLHADMEFEHDMLRMSGELRNIQDLVQQGKNQEAIKQFQLIQNEVKKLNWQPSHDKVQQIFSKTDQEVFKNPLEVIAKDWSQVSLSARGVQEWIRGLGLNHEKEVFQYLQQGQDTLEPALDSLEPNLKSFLIQSLEQDLSPRSKHLVENAISHLTGLQLLSKHDSEASYQSLYVQLPLPWKEGTEPVELQIRSRQKGKQLDWENCHIFFYLDTPKYGETGISLQIVNRDISLQIQNDHHGVKRAFDPYLPEVKERLEQMGYHLNKIAFATTESPNSVVDEAPKTMKNTSAFKRVDVSI